LKRSDFKFDEVFLRHLFEKSIDCIKTRAPEPLEKEVLQGRRASGPAISNEREVKFLPVRENSCVAEPMIGPGLPRHEQHDLRAAFQRAIGQY